MSDFEDLAVAVKFPISFEGHESFSCEIRKLAHAQRLPHGLLLQGSKGIGKFRVAKCLARALFMGQVENFTGAKEAAQGFASDPQAKKIDALLNSGAYADLKVVSIEAQESDSVRTISPEQIRAINDFFSLKSERNNWRVAIIDSVDVLSPKGANAFLKVLEEPPEKSLIILLSHTAANILPTIRSRCQVFTLSPLEKEETKRVITAFDEVNLDHLETMLEIAKGRPGLVASLLRLGGLESLQRLQDAVAKLRQGDGQEVLGCVEAIFENARFEREDETFRAFTEFILEWLAESYVQRARTGKVTSAHNEDQRAFSVAWFEVKRQVEAALIYSLDKKSCCVSVLHQLTSPQAQFKWSITP